ncbi:hypothetical protein PY74_06650 [Lacticaseibacillus rhamnosus]|nr:hypothetical protein PY66_09575 [Lacticaseibacillus rhamnosus]OAU76722.1 hypothetical protein PY74_06650 [Lacticaseibacillus rhamnosus]
MIITRSLAQGSACKDLGRNGQSPAITSKATYTPAPNRAGSRSQKMGQPLDFIHATGPSFRYRKAAWMIVHPHGFVGTFNVTASWMQTVACAVCIRVQTAIQKSCQKSYSVVFADNSSR